MCHEAQERRKCRPLSARAEHALGEVNPAIALDGHTRRSAASHCTAACTTINYSCPRLVQSKNPKYLTTTALACTACEDMHATYVLGTVW